MAMTLLATNPDSTNVASIEFESSIDSTYRLYVFKMYDINAATDGAEFGVQFNVASASGYNENIVSTAVRAYHWEDDSAAAVAYETGSDQQGATGLQVLNSESGADADQSLAGELLLFDPSNTTYETHFMSRTISNRENDGAQEMYITGYVSETAAVDKIQFKMSTGNMDGVIKMYGVA